MLVYLGLSALLTLTAVAMIGASFSMHGRVPANGVQQGDDYLYAVAGGIVAIVGCVLALAAAAAGLMPAAM